MRTLERVQTLGAGSPTRLSGWGANLRSECILFEPSSPRELAVKLDRSGTIARGLGRSYGDPALNTGGQVIGMRRVECYLAFDPESGTLTCEAGVSLAQIIQDFAPRGWFPAITPGTKFVTVGGCIANDVHGKAHHAQGSFSSSVESMTVLLANGEVVRASRAENPALFWGTFGGMGLLGIVLSATLRLRKIETTYFRQRAVRAKNLEAMLEAFDEYDETFTYSVATLDVLARGKHLGRGVLALGEHAREEELPRRFARAPLAVSGPPALAVPWDLPEFALNPLSIRLINSVILQIQANARGIGHYEGFFYPLDMLANWNRAYGKSGFTQYQFVIPLESRERLRPLLDTILSSGELPFLNVLKRLGRASGAPLSFPIEGYTFAIDFPIRKNTVPLLRRLDAMVCDAGGRIYLGKDSYVEATTFRAMYPELDRFLAIKAQYDPENVFRSDLARRVGLLPNAGSD